MSRVIRTDPRGNPFLWKRETKQQSHAVAKKSIELKMIIMMIIIIIIECIPKLIESDQNCFCHSTPNWREFNGFKLDVYFFYYYYFTRRI